MQDKTLSLLKRREADVANKLREATAEEQSLVMKTSRFEGKYK